MWCMRCCAAAAFHLCKFKIILILALLTYSVMPAPSSHGEEFSADKYSVWYYDCSDLMEWKVLPPQVRDFRRIANWYGSMAWWVIHVTWFTVLHDNLNMMQPEAWTCAHLVHVWAMDWNLEQAITCPSQLFINQQVLLSPSNLAFASLLFSHF